MPPQQPPETEAASDRVARVNALVRGSFASAAENYRRSPRHGDPEPLRAMLVLLGPAGDERVLDLATGGGHTAAALAPFVARVVAFDLLPEMLEQARGLFGEVSVRNADRVCGDVHALPFSDAAFDLVTVRCAPHHFANLPGACAEAARCLRPGGRFYVLDCGVPDDPTLADFVNEVEGLRDPSHVKALSRSDWERALRGAGLEVESVRELPNVYRVSEWLDHLNAPAELRAAVLRRLAGAPADPTGRVAVNFTPGEETFTTVRVEALAGRPAAGSSTP